MKSNLKLTIIFLGLIIYSSVSCNSTNRKDDSSITEFTDEEGNVFVKLYKKENGAFYYWETWNTTQNNAVIHWGKLGDIGKDVEITRPTLAEFKNEINSQINQELAEGYNQIPIETQYTVAITIQLNNWGNTEALARREVIRSIITEN